MATQMYDQTAVERVRRLQPTRAQRARLETVRRVLCEPLRVQIIKALSSEHLCVRDLGAVIERPSEVVSQHLRVLREAGVVESVRTGRTVFYGLSARGRRQFAAILADMERRLGIAAES